MRTLAVFSGTMGNTKKNYKEIETLRQRGRLRYLERIQEEQEAEKEINEYHPDDCDADRPDGERSISGERSPS